MAHEYPVLTGILIDDDTTLTLVELCCEGSQR